MLATLQDNGTVLVRITPDHPRYEALRAQAGAGEADGFEAVLGPEHPRHAAIVQYLRGLKPDRYAYDPNEPRDKAGKWAHGERAAALAKKHVDLKQEQLSAYKEVKADAEAANAETTKHENALYDAWTEIVHAGDFEDLESAIQEQDDTLPVHDRFHNLKAIEKAAKEALAVEQKLAPLPEKDKANIKRHGEVLAQLKALGKEESGILDGVGKAQENGTVDEYLAKHQDRYNEIPALRAALHAEYQDLEKRLPEDETDVSEEAVAKNKEHLQTIVMSARAARQSLKIYAQHKREMHAIRRGEPVETKDTPPGRLFNRRGRPQRYQNKALRRSILDAAAQTDTNPSEDQKKAGNYRKGHVMLQGLDISIENPAGSRRSGKGQDGATWSVKMAHHYGYIKCTESEADGDSIDVFIGPEPESEIVFIIDQVDGDWQFDEHKCMLGFTNAAEAKAGYLACYSPGWWGFGSITPMTMDAFKEWIEEGDTGKEVATS